MKYLLTFLCMAYFTININAQACPPNYTTITVRNSQNNSPIKNAICVIKNKHQTYTTTATNQFGEVNINIPKGNYKVYATNFATDTLSIIIGAIQPRLILHLKNNITNPIAYNNISTKKVRKSTKHKTAIPIMAKDKSELDATPALAVPLMAAESVESTKAYPVTKTMDILADAAKPVMEEEFKKEAAAPSFGAGKLTTGEVNDFTKWTLFDEVSREELTTHLGAWKYYMNKRYCVQTVNENNNPVVNATVKLLHNNTVVWAATTDNTGKAELWGNIHEAANDKAYTIEVTYKNKKYYSLNPTQFADGINYFKLPVDCDYSQAVDIAFVIDATGSMGDEIQYLKAEMTDIINRAQAINTDLIFKTSAVFYQDIGDAYVTIKNDFTTNHKLTNDFINKQYAGGGGDFPEAVDEALSVAIHELNWSTNARTKIIFLVLDAPPHEDEATQLRISNLVQAAAAKGIRIVPVAGSGINKNTEYLMRSIALATNGSYTFLTNHSGIGGSHIEPSTDNYKVEKMNDLLIRLITEFSYIPACSNNKEIDTLNNENPFSQVDVTTQLQVYPNPSTGIFYVQLPKLAEATILVTDISGKIIKRIIATDASKIEINLQQHPAGIYFIRVQVADKWLSAKVQLLAN
jgi:hypothetical protein